MAERGANGGGGLTRNNPKQVWRWLKSRPSLKALCERYPNEWALVQRDISAAYERSKTKEQLPTIPQPKPMRAKSSAGNALDPALSQVIRHRMAQLAIKNHGLIAASGVTEGVIRFNWLNGTIVNQLLFARDLERKPASLFWFRLLWPLVWQRKRLMLLAEPEGIYCFYSKQLIEKLADLIGDRSCLEIAAGDGTLTQFLKDRGVRITATDNFSWTHAVKFPKSVIKRDAREAIRVYAPEVVICSWPPAGNGFKARVFKTRSVQMYIVIGSRHKFAAGNWTDYDRQTAFSVEEEESLGRLVLPPELGSAVTIFRRALTPWRVPDVRRSVCKSPPRLAHHGREIHRSRQKARNHAGRQRPGPIPRVAHAPRPVRHPPWRRLPRREFRRSSPPR